MRSYDWLRIIRKQDIGEHNRAGGLCNEKFTYHNQNTEPINCQIAKYHQPNRED